MTPRALLAIGILAVLLKFGGVHKKVARKEAKALEKDLPGDDYVREMATKFALGVLMRWLLGEK